MLLRLVEDDTVAVRSRGNSPFKFSGFRGITQPNYEKHTINDSHHPEESECVAPSVAFSQPSTHPAQTRPNKDATQKQARRFRARWATVIVADQCQRRGYETRLTDSHQKTGGQQLLIGFGMRRQPGNDR